jgi:invasion protein IalB
MKYWIAPARPVGIALATALSVLFVAAANAQTPAPAPKPPAAKPPAAAPAAKPPAAAPAAKPPAAAPAQPAAAPPEQQQAQLIYSPWTKFCRKGEEPDAKQICLTGKDARLETGVPIAQAVLIQPEGAPNVLRVITPLAVLLRQGAHVVVDQSKLASMKTDNETAPFIVCHPAGGCMADFEATPEVITQLKKGKVLVVQAIMFPQGPTISVPLPLEEFGKTLDGPPTDPKVVEEQQKKMQDQLQKRAGAVKKQLEAQQGGQPAK